MSGSFLFTLIILIIDHWIIPMDQSYSICINAIVRIILDHYNDHNSWNGRNNLNNPRCAKEIVTRQKWIIQIIRIIAGIQIIAIIEITCLQKS